MRTRPTCWRPTCSSSSVDTTQRRHAIWAVVARWGLLTRGQQHFNDMFILDLSSRMWSKVEPVRCTRARHAFFVGLPFAYRCHSSTTCPALRRFVRHRVMRIRALLSAGTHSRGFCHARACFLMCVHDRQLVIFGGCGADGNPLNDLWIFDLETLSWTQPIIQGIVCATSRSRVCGRSPRFPISQARLRKRARITAHRWWATNCSSLAAKRAEAPFSAVSYLRVPLSLCSRVLKRVCAAIRRGHAGYRVALVEPHRAGTGKGGRRAGRARVPHGHRGGRRDCLVRNARVFLFWVVAKRNSYAHAAFWAASMATR